MEKNILRPLRDVKLPSGVTYCRPCVGVIIYHASRNWHRPELPLSKCENGSSKPRTADIFLLRNFSLIRRDTTRREFSTWLVNFEEKSRIFRIFKEYSFTHFKRNLSLLFLRRFLRYADMLFYSFLSYEFFSILSHFFYVKKI